MPKPVKEPRVDTRAAPKDGGPGPAERMRDLADVFRALADELVEWETTNETVYAKNADGSNPGEPVFAPVVAQLHMLVRDYNNADEQNRLAILQDINQFIANCQLSGIPQGFEFVDADILALGRLMLDTINVSLAPYYFETQEPAW